jgi:hypothetical protein
VVEAVVRVLLVQLEVLLVMVALEQHLLLRVHP